jgi:cell wall-associated NlpC family hydrolase
MSKKLTFLKLTLIIFYVLLVLIFSFKTHGSNLINPSYADGPDVSSVAQKYNIQSIIVHQVGGNDVASFNATVPPSYPASMAKLIVADVFITMYPDLKNSSLKESLIQMLSNSSNSDANTLINAVGGLSAVTQKAHQLGYTSTNINDYFSDAGNDPNKTSTVKDISDAMNKIFTQKGQGYIVAQDALKADSNNFGLSSIANKWAGVDGVKQVTGNSALFSVNGTQYIIAMYINQPYTGTTCPAVVAIRNATNEILDQLKSLTPNSSTSGSTTATGCFIINPSNIPSGFTLPQGCGDGTSGSGGGNQSVVQLGEKYIKNPKYLYVWGGPPEGYASNNPSSFDCSGFAQWIWYHGTNKKVILPRTTSQMWDGAPGNKLQKFLPSQISQVQPGDLLLFSGGDSPKPGHVGVYTGDNKCAGGKMCYMEFANSGEEGDYASLDVNGTGGAQFYGFLRPMVQ